MRKVGIGKAFWYSSRYSQLIFSFYNMDRNKHRFARFERSSYFWTDNVFRNKKEMASERGKMSSTLSAFGGGEACGARWTLGALLLAPLTAANSSYCAVPAVMLLAIFITIASKKT